MSPFVGRTLCHCIRISKTSTQGTCTCGLETTGIGRSAVCLGPGWTSWRGSLTITTGPSSESQLGNDFLTARKKISLHQKILDCKLSNLLKQEQKLRVQYNIIRFLACCSLLPGFFFFFVIQIFKMHFLLHLILCWVITENKIRLTKKKNKEKLFFL